MKTDHRQTIESAWEEAHLLSHSKLQPSMAQQETIWQQL